MLNFYESNIKLCSEKKILFHSISSKYPKYRILNVVDLNMTLFAVLVIFLGFRDTEGNPLSKMQSNYTKDSIRTMLYYVSSFCPRVLFYSTYSQLRLGKNSKNNFKRN